MAIKTVVVIDDDEHMQSLIGFVLQHNGYRVLQADDAAAPRLALEEQPDSIILDVHMPEMASAVLSQQLREDKRTAHIPIVAMTAAPDRATRAGLIADQWLPKPFHLNDLVRIVAHWTTGSANQPLLLHD